MTRVPLFVAEWTVDGMTAERLVDFRHLLQDAADRVASRGINVRYMRCTYVPEQNRCICLFDADDIEAVRSVNQIAQVPFAEISVAIEIHRASRSNTSEP